jgi:hypothetical protein
MVQLASGLDGSPAWQSRQRRKAAVMIETTLVLNTTRETFESWLVKRWKPAMFETAAGGQYSLGPARRKGGKVTIDGAFATAPNAEDVSTCDLLGAVIAFEAIPLDPGRIEVTGTCYSSGDQTETVYLELLALIGARYPESGLADLLAPGDDAAPAGIRKDREQRRADVRRLWLAKEKSETVRAFRLRAAEELAVSESTIRDELRYLRETRQIEGKMSV